jgi:hypothetical protein
MSSAVKDALKFTKRKKNRQRQEQEKTPNFDDSKRVFYKKPN